MQNMMSLTIAKIPRTLSSKKKRKHDGGGGRILCTLTNKGTQQNPIFVECCSRLYIQFHHH
jgi:hypothetical protein